VAELGDEHVAGMGEHAAEMVIDRGSDEGGAPIVVVSGELDISNAATLEATVAVLAAQRPQRLSFDLSGLRYMDSAGVAVLLGAVSKFKEVRLLEPSQAVRRIVEITGLTEVLSVDP
jgi:anti-sigma B factor antagonist